MPNSNPVSSNVKIGDHSVMFEGSERYAKGPVAAKSVVTGNPDLDRPKESLASGRDRPAICLSSCARSREPAGVS